MKLSSYINRFTFGELSPLLLARTDLGKYPAGCRRLENFIPLLQGPIRRRGGTRFIARTGNTDRGFGERPVVLAAFSFSETTSYMLEFGDHYLRVFHQGAPVLNADGSPYEVATPWGQADLFFADGVRALKEVQSADVMWIVCPTVTPQQIRRHGHTDWRVAPMPGWNVPESADPDTGETIPAMERPNARAIAMFRERLVLAAGQTVYMSQAGAFGNFELTDGAVTTADDPLQIDVYSERMDVIQWLCPAGQLLVGAAGGEFLIGETTTVDPFGPENVKVTPETAFGSSSIQALRVGAVVLFVQRAGRKVREFVYDFQGDSYQAFDLTAAAEHITQSGLVDMAWQSEPWETLWAARADGQLLGFTFSKEQEMNAWHRHTLGGGGAAVTLGLIPARHGGRDELWLAVRRVINGEPVHYIETLEPGHELGGDIADCFFVDSGVTVTGRGLLSATGLAHLNGLEVQILADGGVQPPQKVFGGAVTLQYPADRIQVGLPYTSVMSAVNFEAQMPDGTAQGRRKRIVKVILRLLESSGGQGVTLHPYAGQGSALDPRVASNSERFGPGRDRAEGAWGSGAAPRMDEPPGLFTGDVSVPWPGGYESADALTVIQDQPLPFLLAGIVSDILIEGKN